MLMRRGHGRGLKAAEVDSSLTFKGFDGNPSVDFFRGFRLMFRPAVYALLTSALLAGCGGSTNPFLPDPDPDGDTDDDRPPVLPGTGTTGAGTPITRYEDRNENNGNGYATAITYDQGTDTFSVDNLAFDGENLYARQNTQSWNLGPYRFYEASREVSDPLFPTRRIGQFDHRLLAGVSATGRTDFAIVRTGAYSGYGFGGFVMRRHEGVTLPTSGQAGYNGAYAAIQDFNGRSGLRYVTGEAAVAIDFNDFNAGNAVRGQITDRQIYTVDGTNITAQVIGALNTRYNGTMTELPVLSFRVGPGSIDATGEIRGYLDSFIVDASGAQPTVATYETGTYYALVSGPDADEIVGIIVVESGDPALTGVTVRETGGFVVYRDPALYP